MERLCDFNAFKKCETDPIAVKITVF